MKKAKKLAALVLAMVMAFSLMAVTAAAYGEEAHAHDGVCCEETVIARKPGAPVCGKCNLVMVETGSSDNNGRPIMTYKCLECGATSWAYL